MYDEAAAPGQRLTPLFRGLTPGFLLLFLATGWAYGAITGTIRSHRDIVAMMEKGLVGMLPYLVLVFFAAQFVAMFGWSNLGPITAIVGADQLRAMHAPPALLLPMLTTMSAWLDFLIASGSAKWTAMAPVAAPMMMLLGISPEMTTAAYRVGDTVTNLISPLNPYFVLTLTFCRRWIPDFRLGSLLALVLPLSIAFFLGGAVLTAIWVAFEIPVGPGAAVSYAAAWLRCAERVCAGRCSRSVRGRTAAPVSSADIADFADFDGRMTVRALITTDLASGGEAQPARAASRPAPDALLEARKSPRHPRNPRIETTTRI